MSRSAFRVGSTGALVVVSAFSLVALAGCGDEKATRDPAGNGRSDVVTGSSTAATATQKPSAQPSAKPSVAKKLCTSPPAADGKKLPEVDFGHIEADGAPSIEGPIATGGGGWTWVNLWAGYCGPCKEEVPRLLRWKADLKKAGTPVELAFVSLDDDERQAKQFLGAQPAAGLRSSLFLPEGKARSQFLKELSLKDPPELPVHVLVDPTGAVRCVIQGAIDDVDYAQVSQIVARK